MDVIRTPFRPHGVIRSKRARAVRNYHNTRMTRDSLFRKLDKLIDRYDEDNKIDVYLKAQKADHELVGDVYYEMKEQIRTARILMNDIRNPKNNRTEIQNEINNAYETLNIEYLE